MGTDLSTAQPRCGGTTDTPLHAFVATTSTASQSPGSMKYPLTQKRFSHRRSLVFAKPSTARKISRQSTLTQLDFISTPPTKQEDSDGSYSEDDLADVQPKKRRKIEASNSRKDATLTQIGFVHPGEAESDAEVIGDSQPTSEIELSPQREIKTRHLPSPEKTTRNVTASPNKQHGSGEAARETILSSPMQQHLAATGVSNETIFQSPARRSARKSAVKTTRFASSTKERLETKSVPPSPVNAKSVPTTPKTTRRLELPSSQTPASVALSPRREPQASSPLHERSTNASPIKTSRLLKRVSTVQDSQFEDTLATQTDSDDEDLNEKLATLPEQCTYDPADSALDRDAARFAMTQMERKLCVQDTLSDEIDLVEQAERCSVGHDATKTAATSGPRPSQISTVMPTQSSPHQSVKPALVLSSPIAQFSMTQSSPPPLVFTSASTERQETIVIPSSPSLPQPQWSESVWNKESAQTQDFSLPPPPPLNWSSSQFSLSRHNS